MAQTVLYKSPPAIRSSHRLRHLEQKLIRDAVRKYKQIRPCDGKKTLRECFTYWKGYLLFWFNTIDGSTRLLRIEAKRRSSSNR